LSEGGLFWRLFFGRVGVLILLRLEVEDARLSRELDARLEYLEIQERLGTRRGVASLGRDRPDDEPRKSDLARLELNAVSSSNSHADAILLLQGPSQTMTLAAEE